MKDLKSQLAAGHSLGPSARTASANGSQVDLQGFEGALVCIYHGAWTDGVHTYSIQESNTSDSGFTAVAAADLQGTAPAVSSADSDNTVTRIGYLGSKRYLRVIVTIGGSPLVTGAVSAALIVRGEKRHGPVAS